MKIDEDALAESIIAAGRTSNAKTPKCGVFSGGRDNYTLEEVIRAMVYVDELLERDGGVEIGNHCRFAAEALGYALWAWRVRDAEIPY